MADENIVTNIVAKADFSNLIADLNKVSFSLSKLQDQLVASNKMLAAQVGVMNRSFADTLRSTGQFSTHFVSLSSDVEKFGSQLDRGQMRLGKFFQVYRQHATSTGGLVRDLAKQQVQLQNAIMQPLGKNAQGLMQYNVHIPRGLDLIKNKSLIARQELQIMNKVVQEGANSLINWGKNTQWAGRQLTVGLTVPLAAFGKASADAFKQADEQLVRLTKVYGGVAAVSAQELGKVRADVSKTAEDLAKSYGSSFKDTIALAADIAATGKQGNDLLGSIRETTRLAVLGEVDRQDAMKATLAIQTAFKQNTEELAESINFLNAVENQTSTTLNDLVEAIPKAGPIIKGLGGSIQDLALYLTAMREGGINASEGANALKSGLASLINPTKVAKDLFNGFGISLTDIVQKNAGNTTATILELQAALETLNPLQKQQALEQLFGKFQFARMNALFENLGKQGSQTLQVLDLMKASSQELGALATRELGQVTESASGKYRRAVEGLKADLAGIGEQFLKINTSLINFVDGIIKFVQKLPDPIKQALGFMGMLTAAAGPLIMLTGVLGNFFGYIIKGAYHFKSLFKGGEGWRLLTPEILAAQKAGNLVEQTFYSDAKAAAVLKQAIAGLTAEFTILQQKASSAAMSVNPAISTTAGNVIVAGPRVVNPNHPLVGKIDTRAATHHNPRGLMNQAQRDAQTIHSVTPGSIDVNQKIGTVPQIFMAGDMPKIEGLTSSRGASTGIVAGEAAKWHALMGSLSMLSKREVATLKKEIARTGTFSEDISNTFSQLLVPMTDITTNAANRSAQIVAQLQSGKITMEAARAKIIALNTEIEAMMAAATTQVATSLGRTASLTQVPLTSQAIVSNTGKANLKEIFRPGRKGKTIVDTIARALGVRTYGAGYSTETTMPKKLATGGMVVPGPRSDTTDTQFMNLIEGDVVLNRKASDALMGYNKGGRVVPAMVTPGEIIVNNPTPEEAEMLLAYNNQFAVGGRVMASKNNYGNPPIGLVLKQLMTRRNAGTRARAETRMGEYRGHSWLAQGNATKTAIDNYLSGIPKNKRLEAARAIESFGFKLKSTGGRNKDITASTHSRSAKTLETKHLIDGDLSKDLTKITGVSPSDALGAMTHATHLTKAKIINGKRMVSRYTVDYDASSNLQANTGSLKVGDFISRNLERLDKYNVQMNAAGVPLDKNIRKKIEKNIDKNIKSYLLAKSGGNKDMLMSDNKPGTINLEELIPFIDNEIISNGGNAVNLNKLKNLTQVRKQYNLGGMVGKALAPKFKSQLNKKLGITWGQGLAGDGLTNNPPTSGYGNLALQIGMGKKLFGGSGLTPRAQNLMYDALAKELEQTTPDTYLKVQGVRGPKLARAMDPSQTNGMLFGAASTVAGHRGISKKDREILALWSSDPFKNNYPKGLLSKITGKMFGYNRGGMVSMPPQIPIPAQDGKYNMGGVVGGRVRSGKHNYGIPGLDISGLNQPALIEQMGLQSAERQGPLSAFTSGLRNPYGKSAFINRQMPKMGMGASMGIGMGGMMAGSIIGGGAGQAVMLASSIASMLPYFGGLSKGIGIVTKLASVLGKLTIPGALIGSLAFVGKLILDAKNNAEDLGKANRLAFGGTQESFASVGITKFKTLSDRMKEVNEQIDLNKAKAQSAYEQYTKGGPTGITLSIAELNEAIENAKKNQTEYINAFNNIDSGGVNKYAADLKAQFVAMGLSASEASNQIYAMVKASEKAGQALSAVTTSDFRNIIDQTTALTRLFDNLGKASTVNNFNVEEFATGLDTLTSSVIAYQEGLIKIDKIDPSKSVDSAKSLQMTMEKIVKIDGSRSTLGIKQVESLKQQNVIYASILKDTESLASITAKILLYHNELGRIVDLSAISGPAAIIMAQNYADVLNGINKITEDSSDNNPLKALIDPINKAKKTSADYAKVINSAQKQDESYYSKKIKAIDLEIKKIKDAANERRKALQEQQSMESTELEIKKKQIEYQDAVASGNMSAAAQAQLSLQQLVKEQQLKNAISAIDKKEEKDLETQENKIEKIRKQEEAFKKGIQSATTKSAESATNVANLEKNLDRLERLSVLYAASTSSKARQDFAKEAQSIIFAMKSGTSEEKQAASDLEKQYNIPVSKPQSLNLYGAPTAAQETLNLYGAAQESTGQKVLGAMQKEMERRGISDQVFGKAVANFKAAVEEFKGSTGTKNVTKNYNPGRREGVDPSNKELADVISGEGLKEKDIFTYQGKTYEVKKDLLRRLYGAQKKAMGGQVRNYEMGSFGGVRGPGTATSDSIPAMLSNGEYVLRASAVDAIGVPMLDQINKMAMGGLATRYNVSKQMSMPSNTMGYNKGGPIHYYNVGGLAVNAADGQSPIEIARMTMAMMNSVSTNQAKAVGPSKLVGRGYLA
jgi:TP901 family phage tail tape measure protein